MKTQKGFAPILIAIIAGIVLLAGGGAYYYSKQNKSLDFTDLMKGLSATTPKLESDTKQENPPVVNSKDTSPIPTGWKTYKNENYGFEISYPADYVSKDDGTQEFPYISIRKESASGKPQNVIYVTAQKHAFSYKGNIRDFVKNNLSNTYKNIEKIEDVNLGRLDGVKVYGVVDDANGVWETVDIYAVDPTRPDFEYVIRYWKYDIDDSDTKTFEKILSTFKFTK
jgi:hypothetical protein